MRLVQMAAAFMLIALPVFAADYPSANSENSPDPAQSIPNVEGQTAATDSARQDYYQDKLDAAKAQSQVDSAKADRDAAEDRAAEDKADQHAAQDQQ